MDTGDLDYARFRVGRQLTDAAPLPPTTATPTATLSVASHSRLTEVVLDFDMPIDTATLDIGLVRLADGALVEVGGLGGRILGVPDSGWISSLRLTFDNAGGADISDVVEYGSLADGRWRWSIPSLDFESDLHRLFGDVNGDATVDGSTDFAHFGAAFGAASTAFDFNADGTVDGPTDFAQFGARFGRTLV